RESERTELRQRAHVDEPLEINDLLDRPPVVDPAAPIEFRLVREIEAKPLGVAVQLQQEPALLLADTERRLLAADVALRQAVAEPVLGLADERDVLRLETDLLAQLPVHRTLDALFRLDAALRELPPAAVPPSGNQHTPVAVHQDDADVRPIAFLVAEVHGFGRGPAHRPAKRHRCA